MSSFIRSAARTGTVFALSAILAAGAVGFATSAQAATEPATQPTDTATAAATPGSDTAATDPAADTAASDAAAEPASDGTAPDAGDATSGNADDTSSAAATTDPSLSAQDDAGDHAMGSSIPASDPAYSPTPKTRSLLQSKAAATAITGKASGIRGLDVSAYQPQIDWKVVYKNAGRFVYIKATEGTTYRSSTFASQYKGSYSAGLIRGAYHYATPNTSSGATQAKYFVANGGTWTADGKTLPPLLDVEYGYDSTCWGLSQSAMVKWISDFSLTVLSLTGTRPAIYTTTNWWKTCTGNSAAFKSNPLMVAYYSTTATNPSTLGASWSKHTIWQWWHAGGVFPGDQDVFNGTSLDLSLFARGGGVSGGTPVAYRAADAGAVAYAPTTMDANDSIESSNGQYRLLMQTNGNLVMRGNGYVLWQSKTAGNAGARAVMQADGNFVVYSKASKALWQSGTAGTGTGARVALLSNGDLQVKTSGVVRWSTGISDRAALAAGSSLKASQILHDDSGRLQAAMRTDGNFVVYIGGKAHWSTKTGGHAGAYVTLHSNGNLVVWSRSRTVLWQSKTTGTGASNRLGMQSNGNLVLRNAAGKALWYTNTAL